MGNKVSDIHVANATGSPLRIFYRTEEMTLEEMVKEGNMEIGATVSKSDASVSGKTSTSNKQVFRSHSKNHFIHVPVGEFTKFAGEGTIYATICVVDESDHDACLKIIAHNYRIPINSSFIVTPTHNIKFQRRGETNWIDESGKDYSDKVEGLISREN